MGFRVRKSIKIAPGVKLNLTQNGVSSVSVGKNGARVTVGKKGTRSTLGVNGTGVSYSHYQPHKKSNQQTPLSLNITNQLMTIAKNNAVIVYDSDMANQDTQAIIQEQIHSIAQQLLPLPQNQQDEGLNVYTEYFEKWIEILEKTHQKWIDDGYDEDEFSAEQAMEEINEETKTIFMIWGIGFFAIIAIGFIVYKMFA